MVYVLIMTSVLLCFRGESPSEADGNLLDVARKVELYSVKFHSAKVCVFVIR